MIIDLEDVDDNDNDDDGNSLPWQALRDTHSNSEQVKMILKMIFKMMMMMTMMTAMAMAKMMIIVAVMIHALSKELRQYLGQPNEGGGTEGQCNGEYHPLSSSNYPSIETSMFWERLKKGDILRSGHDNDCLQGEPGDCCHHHDHHHHQHCHHDVDL